MSSASHAEWQMPTPMERLAYLDDLIFVAVCEGLDVSILQQRRAELEAGG